MMIWPLTQGFTSGNAVLLLFLLRTATTITSFVQAIHIDYDKPRSYAMGQQLMDVAFNKLTSPRALTSMDLKHIKTCPRSTNISTGDNYYTKKNKKRWQTAVDTWHGDAWEEGPQYILEMGRDLYCQQLCWMDWNSDSDGWSGAIAQGFHFNLHVDGMPVAVRTETFFYIFIRYWGGVPLGRTGDDDEDEVETLYVYNHWNIEVWYQPANDNDGDKFQVVRTIIEPFSIRHENNNGTLMNPIDSCIPGNNNTHTSYEMLEDVDPQPTNGRVLFTYDVIWKRLDRMDEKRWTIFLNMDDSVPLTYQVAGLILAILINAVLFGSLIAWMLRDLSYKPIYHQDYCGAEVEGGLGADNFPNKDASREMNLWPLSTLIFIPPRHLASLFCALVGTGFHLGIFGLFYVCFWRMGIINSTLKSGVVTAAVLLYTLTAWLGGLVTGRLSAVFHATRKKALWTTAGTAVGFPFLSMIAMQLSYDALPDDMSPHAVAAGGPIWWIWIFLIIPSVLLGGYVGHAMGRLADFPVASCVEKGYQDLDLKFEENEDATIFTSPYMIACYKCWNRQGGRTVALFFLAGIPPVLCCFIPFSYGVAGPIFVGTYSSTKLISIAPYCLFITCAGGVSALLYYRQIRLCEYQWWWPSFVSGASCGLHIFILALSWLFFNVNRGDVSGSTFGVWFFWFFWISFGVACVCGAAGVTACIMLNQFLYAYATAGVDFHLELYDMKDATGSPDTKGTEESTPEKHMEFSRTRDAGGEEASFCRRVCDEKALLSPIVPTTFRMASSSPLPDQEQEQQEQLRKEKDDVPLLNIAKHTPPRQVPPDVEATQMIIQEDENASRYQQGYDFSNIASPPRHDSPQKLSDDDNSVLEPSRQALDSLYAPGAFDFANIIQDPCGKTSRSSAVPGGQEEDVVESFLDRQSNAASSPPGLSPQRLPRIKSPMPVSDGKKSSPLVVDRLKRTMEQTATAPVSKFTTREVADSPPGLSPKRLPENTPPRPVSGGETSSPLVVDRLERTMEQTAMALVSKSTTHEVVAAASPPGLSPKRLAETTPSRPVSGGETSSPLVVGRLERTMEQTATTPVSKSTTHEAVDEDSPFDEDEANLPFDEQDSPPPPPKDRNQNGDDEDESIIFGPTPKCPSTSPLRTSSQP